MLVARREDRLEALASELRVTGRHVQVLVADLATDEGQSAVADRLGDTASPVDLLVNNAGFGAYGDMVELPVDTRMDMVEVNVGAVTRLARAALVGMVARGRGGVIKVASTAAFQPDPHAAVAATTGPAVVARRVSGLAHRTFTGPR